MRAIFLLAVLEKLITNGLRSATLLWLLSLMDTPDRGAGVEWAALLGAWIYLLPLFVQKGFEAFSEKSQLRVSYLFIFFGITLFFLDDLGFKSTSKPQDLFKIASFFIILGTSFYRSLLPRLLSAQLNKNNQNITHGFTRFYTLMNIGTFIGVILVGVLGEVYGWIYARYSLLLTAIGLFFCVELYISRSSKELKRESPFTLIHCLILLALSGVSFSLRFPSYWMNGIALLFIIWIIQQKKFVFLLWVLVHGIFWMIYDQASTTLVVLSDSGVDRSIKFISDRPLPNTVFLLIDPVFNILIGSVLVSLMRKHDFLRPNLKIIGISSLVVFCLFCLIVIQFQQNWFIPLPIFEFVLVHLIFVLGEQFTVPTGLAYASSAENHGPFGVSFWFFGIAYFTWISGLIGQFTIERILTK